MILDPSTLAAAAVIAAVLSVVMLFACVSAVLDARDLRDAARSARDDARGYREKADHYATLAANDAVTCRFVRDHIQKFETSAAAAAKDANTYAADAIRQCDTAHGHGIKAADGAERARDYAAEAYRVVNDAAATLAAFKSIVAAMPGPSLLAPRPAAACRRAAATRPTNDIDAEVIDLDPPAPDANTDGERTDVFADVFTDIGTATDG
mgnify:CR=1 FL=1